MSNIRRFLLSDEHPTPFANSCFNCAPATQAYSKQLGAHESNPHQVLASCQGTYEAAVPPNGHSGDEGLTFEAESSSNSSVWSPRTVDGPEYETIHGPAYPWNTNLQGYGPYAKFNVCTGMPEDAFYGDRNAYGYISPADVQRDPYIEDDVDAIAEPDPEMFPAGPGLHIPSGAHYMSYEAPHGVAKAYPALSIPDDSGVGSSIHGNSIRSPSFVEEDADMLDEGKADESSDYQPAKKRTKSKKGRRGSRNPKSTSPILVKRSARKGSSNLDRPTKVVKPYATEPSSTASLPDQNNCPSCPRSFPSPSTLNKHVMTVHTRPFSCVFSRYGCPATFGAKNEWKRHVSSQHLKPGVYRCDMGTCIPQPRQHRRKSASSPTDRDNELSSFNEFNRKDLFTQHIRRMHGPATKADKDAFENSLASTRQRCWVKLHDIPQRTICGFCLREGKEAVFEGRSAWEDRMEHVGRHLERGEKDDNEDLLLRDWMIREELLQYDRMYDRWRVVGIGGKRRPSGDEDAEGDSE